MSYTSKNLPYLFDPHEHLLISVSLPHFAFVLRDCAVKIQQKMYGYCVALLDNC